MSNNIPDPILRKEKYLAKIAENTAGGGSDPVILQANKNITANGIVNPDSGFDGFAKVTVNVPNTYSAADEGKVVSDGALISQVSTSVTTNDTYDTTYYNEVTVAVPNTYTAQDEGKVVSSGALVAQTSANINTNGTVNTTTNNEVVVAVPNTYTAADEGKVVNSGALTAQTAYPSTVTQNDTYDTTNYNSITVDVPTGGGSVEEKDVNFYDYDGTVLYSYTAQEFLQLTEMPANPNRTSEGLTAQGWNWSFADATAYVTDYGKLDIGQMYITSDGATKLFITLEEGRLNPCLKFALNGTATIDWGDNSTPETVTGSSTGQYYYYPYPHTYLSAGDYVISIKVASGGSIAFSGQNNVGGAILNKSGATNEQNRVYQNCLKKLFFGSNVASLYSYVLDQFYSLEYITIPNGITSFDTYYFRNCYSLKHITIPKSVTSIGRSCFENCNSLKSISLPCEVTSLNGTDAFRNLFSLTHMIIPSNVTSIGALLPNAYSFAYLIIPNRVTSITSAISNAFGLGFIKFTSQTPPTAGDTPFRNLPTDCKIYVPSLVSNLYMTAQYYPNPSNYNYIGYATYTSGDTLPTLTTDETYNLTWYATVEDAIAQTNPITTGNGNEVYSRATAVV